MVVVAGVVLALSPDYLGVSQTTPDPNTSAKASRYKWEAHRDTNRRCLTTFCQEEGILLQKHCDRNGHYRPGYRLPVINYRPGYRHPQWASGIRLQQ